MNLPQVTITPFQLLATPANEVSPIPSVTHSPFPYYFEANPRHYIISSHTLISI